MPAENLTEQKVALVALHDVTPPETVGAFRDSVVSQDGVVTVTFHATMPGYPGWVWTVALAGDDGSEPTVLELELLPDDGALVAPEWVPWSQRLAEFKEAQRRAREAGEISEDDEPVIVPDDDDFDGEIGLEALDDEDVDDDDVDDDDEDDADDDEEEEEGLDDDDEAEEEVDEEDVDEGQS